MGLSIAMGNEEQRNKCVQLDWAYELGGMEHMLWPKWMGDWGSSFGQGKVEHVFDHVEFLTLCA